MNPESIEYVPLEIELKIQVDSSYYQSDVLGVVHETLGSSIDNHGKKGFFHRDNLTFGQTIFLSQILQLIINIDGIKSVDPVIFNRLRIQTDSLIQEQIILGFNEIARLDNNPQNLENGRLKIIASGGKKDLLQQRL